MRSFLFVLLVLLSSVNISAQRLPKVFLLGEHESQFEKLTNEHNVMLLTVCNEDMDVAYDKWQAMLVAMENYAEEMDYDLKGSKFWLNVFWMPNGKIKHIVYHLKPNSRNLDQEKLKLFFISFINRYTIPLAYDRPYSHYGSAAFPIQPVNKLINKSSSQTNKVEMPE